MNNTYLRTAVGLQVLRAWTMDKAAELREDERGELGSWLILAAGLAVAAAAAIALLGPWFNTKVGQITAN